MFLVIYERIFYVFTFSLRNSYIKITFFNPLKYYIHQDEKHNSKCILVNSVIFRRVFFVDEDLTRLILYKFCLFCFSLVSLNIQILTYKVNSSVSKIVVEMYNYCQIVVEKYRVFVDLMSNFYRFNVKFLSNFFQLNC